MDGTHRETPDISAISLGATLALEPWHPGDPRPVGRARGDRQTEPTQQNTLTQVFCWPGLEYSAGSLSAERVTLSSCSRRTHRRSLRRPLLLRICWSCGLPRASQAAPKGRESRARNTCSSPRRDRRWTDSPLRAAHTAREMQWPDQPSDLRAGMCVMPWRA